MVSPVTVIGLAAPVAVLPPGLEVTVYDVIGMQPDAGAVKLTVAWALPASAVTFVGAPGTVAGVTLLERPENGPDPIALVALTLNL